LLAVVLAGQAAETLYYRGDTALNGQDYAEAVDLLASWPADEIEQVRREALDAATEALQADWKLVEALAERLRDGGVF